MFLFGAVLFCWTVVLFQSVAEGTLAPWTDKKKLVVIGPYAHCRNPMIAGVLLILISESLWFRSMPILLWASVFFVINTCFFILREEPFLEKKFGDQYRTYKRQVPRWIPKVHHKHN